MSGFRDGVTDTNAGSEEQEIVRRKEKLKATLDKREEDRVQSIRHKRNDERISKQDSDEYFTLHFKEECDSLLSKIHSNDIDASNGVQVVDYLEGLSASYEKLLKFLNDSTVFLRSYQLEQAQKTLNQVQLAITKRKRDVVPKNKFTFKAKRNYRATVKEVPLEPLSTGLKILNFSADQCDISDRFGETIVVAGNEINRRDVSLSNLRKCRVELCGFPGTVHFSDVDDCLLLCGPVSGSVFVNKCVNSNLVTGCQQLRVHNTTDTDFYLHVTSRAIIEDTTRVRFAPYNWSYENLLEDFTQSGLSRETNNWNKIDDFNWLASDTISPNWSVLPNNDRKTTWTKQ